LKTITYILFIAIIGSLVLSSCEKKSQFNSENTKRVQITSLTFTESSTRDDRFYIFSGISDLDLSSMSGKDWTYELWIKVDPKALIGSKDSLSGQTAGGASIGEREEIFELYLIEDDNADYAVKFNRLDKQNLPLGTMQSGDSKVNLKFNEWTHIAISRSSIDQLTKFYINGKLIDSSDDPLWIQQVNDTWLDLNYMYRSDKNINFFKGSYDNIRVSYIDRYPKEFTPNQAEKFTVDKNTLIQLNLDNNLTPFDPIEDFDKVEVEGVYCYFVKVVNTTNWENEELMTPIEN